MTGISISDLEAAINHWRALHAAQPDMALPAPLQALAAVYAQMIYTGARSVPADTLPPEAMAAWLAWYDTQPDTPCIAICSTSQGDAVCKGCGRSFEEVQQWLSLSPVEKRAVWQRITHEGTALRFTRYAERAVRPSGR